MKILLVGPYPPPHGGVSVHVWGIHRRLTEAGVPCRVLDTGHARSWSFNFALLQKLRAWVWVSSIKCQNKHRRKGHSSLSYSAH
jgi:hypothetical protein